MRHAWAAAAVAFLALTGCGGPLVMKFRGGERVNMNPKEENIPVDVRVFLLKDKAAFMNASIERAKLSGVSPARK